MSVSNPIQRIKDVNKLNAMISEHENKLDQKINEAVCHMMNYSCKINDRLLPEINNKKTVVPTKYTQSGNNLTRSIRTRSMRTRSFIQKSSDLSFTDTRQLDCMIDAYRNKTTKRQFQSITVANKQEKAFNRPIGSQKFGKPKFIKRNPQVLPKQIRCNPFSDRNAIKANQLQKGMLHLVQSGKVGPNIDIITAFQKGRPVLESHQVIVHQAQERFAFAQFDRGFQKQKKLKSASINKPTNYVSQIRIQNSQFYAEQSHPNWALTMPEVADLDRKQGLSPRRNNSIKNNQQDLEDYHSIQFHHHKLVKDEQFYAIKRLSKYYENWGKVLCFIQYIENVLAKYHIDLAYINSKKMMSTINKNLALKAVHINQINQCLIKNNVPKNSTLYSSPLRLENIKNLSIKADLAATKIQAAYRRFEVRKRFINILQRRKIQNHLRQWIRNGKLIKQYRNSLKDHQKQVQAKFQKQQQAFRLNYPTIQSSKHFEIHIPNRDFMNGFRYAQQMSNTEVTRIFNLQNPQTHLIYICPWEISIQTINYYFKIMELEQIERYQDRVTFIELNSLQNKVAVPQSLNTSAKLYYNSKVLRKLRHKIGQTPSYFVINQPTQTDVKLSAFLGIPIFSGNFQKINLTRSILNSQIFNQSLPDHSVRATPGLSIPPKSHTVLALSNLLIRYCQSHKETNKFILKINDKHQSSGLALISYPFTSLPQLYTNTALAQPYYYRSIQKYYIQFIKRGGTVQKYEEGMRTITLSGKILHDYTYLILGTFQRISSGFVNIAYIFPQKIVPHKLLIQQCNPLLEKLAQMGHFGEFQITLMIDNKELITLQQIELYPTKITNSLSYFKFLAGGYFNQLGQFITKITGEDGEDQQIATMQPRGYCYIPFVLHFGLSEKQSLSFFQLCRIGGVSFDLQNKFGSTFILLGSMKNCIGIITSAKDKKMSTRLMSKTLEFLIKQNSHNISNEMLQEKQIRIRDRLNILALKQRIESI